MRACLSCFCILAFSFLNVRGEDEQNQESIGLTAEWVEIELKALPRLLRKHGVAKESSALCAAVEKLGEDGKVKWHTRFRSGERLKVGSYEEYIYRTEYDPPEIPGKGNLTETGGDAVPMKEATPTAFETKNVGVTMEVTSRLLFEMAAWFSRGLSLYRNRNRKRQTSDFYCSFACSPSSRTHRKNVGERDSDIACPGFACW